METPGISKKPSRPADRDALDAREEGAAVYETLRAIASRLMGGPPRHRALQPTEIVHEAYLKLAAAHPSSWRDESHFMAVAVRALRQVLVDSSRANSTKKRGGGERVFSLDSSAIWESSPPIDPLELDEALRRLGETDQRAAHVVELRFFGGMSEERIAEHLGVAAVTVRRDWRYARAWLHAELGLGGMAT